MVYQIINQASKHVLPKLYNIPYLNGPLFITIPVLDVRLVLTFHFHMIMLLLIMGMLSEKV